MQCVNAQKNNLTGYEIGKKIIHETSKQPIQFVRDDYEDPLVI